MAPAPVTQEKTANTQDATGLQTPPAPDTTDSLKVGAVVEANPSNQQRAATNTFEGRIVSMTGDKLVMSNDKGKEFSKTVAADAALTCDGIACKTDDLKAGHKIRVTTMADNRTVVTGIESLNKNAAFASCS